MLADSSSHTQIGQLGGTTHPSNHFCEKLTEFIADCLPLWRDDPDRPEREAEKRLTQTLCNYLRVAVKEKPGYDHIQFEHEPADECNSKRGLDIAVMPGMHKIIIEGKSYSKYETLLQIECKRLPTPPGSKRDEREYVYSSFSTTGGVQRFKEGYHGANHKFTAMIGYIQDKTCSDWTEKIREWIEGLTIEQPELWTSEDHLVEKLKDRNKRTMILQSTHTRKAPLPKITIRHLWVELN